MGPARRGRPWRPVSTHVETSEPATPARTPRRPGELVFAVILTGASLWLLWQAYLISGLTGLVTPGTFPMLAAAAMVVSSLVNLVRTVRRPAPTGPRLRFLREITPLRHVIVLALIAAYVAAMPWLGFLVASGLFLLAAFQILWRRHVLVTLVLTAAALGAIYVVFRVIFQVVLPSGTLLQGLF